MLLLVFLLNNCLFEVSLLMNRQPVLFQLCVDGRLLIQPCKQQSLEPVDV